MTNRITLREDEKPLLVMDGTGDPSKLWLFDPHGRVFLCYAVENQLTLTGIYQRENKGWIFMSINPSVGRQPVPSQETVALLEEMENAVFLSAKRGEASREL
jgi:hypothetical protein